jgi:DNA processing protein
MIRKNTAALITSADDFVEAMGWTADGGQRQVVERQLFPDLTYEEQAVVSQLKQENDQQLNQLSVRTNISVSQLVALLFQLEMKGVVRPMAGGTYHLLS